ncbi:MAG: phosphoribosylformylglycinamidine synthase I [Candidatus Omnitrophica bacterium CG07_land_8_20_14_0_80_50_8]|nr:MAG: phosphoribosylformylglycinamidine synthase I [Candidatus Omnitrophica bacterium CG07_land_8_20_14_0_80_50_8]
MKFGVVVFPGSNCDYDCYHVLKHVLKAETEFVWHKERNISKFDCMVLPGGFSYGDYLRTGAIARFSPVMESVVKHAQQGKLVIGICNGFQILLESGLLPGAMLHNESLQFVCRFVDLRVENTDTPFTRKLKKGALLKIPIAHGEGNYFADRATLLELNKNNQVLVRYADCQGQVSKETNPNGSLENIAGICNKRRNVFGLMPHPERASEKELGSTDGIGIFESIIQSSS